MGDDGGYTLIPAPCMCIYIKTLQRKARRRGDGVRMAPPPGPPLAGGGRPAARNEEHAGGWDQPGCASATSSPGSSCRFVTVLVVLLALPSLVSLVLLSPSALPALLVAVRSSRPACHKLIASAAQARQRARQRSAPADGKWRECCQQICRPRAQHASPSVGRCAGTSGPDLGVRAQLDA